MRLKDMFSQFGFGFQNLEIKSTIHLVGWQDIHQQPCDLSLHLGCSLHSCTPKLTIIYISVFAKLSAHNLCSDIYLSQRPVPTDRELRHLRER